ncbi:MAG: FISUMP domain-containing protein [Bacteroidales bacterium]
MRSKLLLMSLFVLPLALLLSCEKKEVPSNEFTVNPQEVTVEGNTIYVNGAEQSFLLDIETESSTGKWNVACPIDDLWLTHYRNNIGKLVVSLQQNNSGVVRSSSITVILGDNRETYNIVQDFYRILEFQQPTIEVGASKGSYIAFYNTNILLDNLTPSLDEECDWIDDIQIIEGQIFFRVSKNHSYDNDRSAKIYLDGDETRAELTINQPKMFGLPYVIDLSGINFAATLNPLDEWYPSYEVWDRENNIKLGELYKEYLFKYDAVSSESIVRESSVVAYPRTAEGEVNLLEGYVANNGGLVTWKSNITVNDAGSSFISQYLPGNLNEMPQTLYIHQGSYSFTEEPLDLEPGEEALVVNATIEPIVVEDYRSGPANNHDQTEEFYDYTVVKLAGQFWLGQNLATTRMRDGTNIPTDFTNAQWAANCTPVVKPMCLVSYTGTASNFVDANSEEAADYRRLVGCLYTFPTIYGVDYDNDDPSQVLGEDVLSPVGWTVPSRDEVNTMVNYITQASATPASDPLIEIAANVPYYDGTALEYLINIAGLGIDGTRNRSARTGGYNSVYPYLFSTHYSHVAGALPMQTAWRVNHGNLPTTVAIWYTSYEFGYAHYIRCIKKGS